MRRIEGLQMGLSINPAAERMVRELTARRGVRMTEALRELLAEEEARAVVARETERQARYDAVMAIAARVSATPNVSDMIDDEILGYDEEGIPSPSGNFALTDVKVARW